VWKLSVGLYPDFEPTPKEEAHEVPMSSEKRRIEMLSLSGVVCATQT